ncbi:hypothetical protein EZV76_01685 [Flagellimonas alvinocaridis]|uniref:Uncharacterized protein n=1 Tax=Flagellimonas alvinocaridis TaxID=2530200 RepID=A0A4V4HXH6_9FLAO|nr:hypothetical protein [Allomuricauda alvinocaridis]THV61066.1 hypothetical protein EZV76_01685 [Allomuricauda alvinocaridis]
MKKQVKSTFGLCLVATAFTLVVSGYLYYSYNCAPTPKKNEYSNYVGYISQNTALLNDVYELCGGKRIYYVYNGASYRAYNKNKGFFRKNILKEYENKGYDDSGYLNFRFLVNCEGNPGWFEIIQTDLTLQETELDEDMVSQLLQLTSDPRYWNILLIEDEPINYYMYISYRIENGTITEILP